MLNAVTAIVVCDNDHITLLFVVTLFFCEFKVSGNELMYTTWNEVESIRIK